MTVESVVPMSLGTWGKLKDEAGWICISDNLQTYLKPVSSENAEVLRDFCMVVGTMFEPDVPYKALYKMNLREDPSQNAKIVGTLDKDSVVEFDEFSIEGTAGSWGRIHKTNQWVCLEQGEVQYFEQDLSALD